MGAGPGDPELITLKGVKALREADAVLYDALVNESLLDHARPNAQRIFVGKKAGNHAYAQEEIHALIAHLCKQGLHVVRLKGGDPFVFGRGWEEWSFAETLGFPVEIVPGVTSAIAVPESLGIPITKRLESESFWVVTGTTSGNRLSKDIRLAAQSSATVIVLMGLGKIRQILQLFSEQGKDNVPAAVIMEGTTDHQQWVTGHVHNLAERTEAAGIQSPAIIVIGEVVADIRKVHPEHINRSATEK